MPTWNPPDGIQPGDHVTAKRSGRDERLTAEQEFDLEPYADKGSASDDRAGPLEVSRLRA